MREEEEEEGGKEEEKFTMAKGSGGPKMDSRWCRTGKICDPI